MWVPFLGFNVEYIPNISLLQSLDTKYQPPSKPGSGLKVCGGGWVGGGGVQTYFSVQLKV